MNERSLASALDRPATSVERPKPVPMGHYTFVIQGMPREDKSSQKKTPYWEYTLKAIAAHDDVDPEALEVWMKRADGSTKAISDIVMKPKFYLTDDALFMLKDFITASGVDEADYETLRQGGQQCLNKSIVGHVTHRPTENGGIFAECRNFSKVED